MGVAPRGPAGAQRNLLTRSLGTTRTRRRRRPTSPRRRSRHRSGGWSWWPCRRRFRPRRRQHTARLGVSTTKGSRLETSLASDQGLDSPRCGCCHPKARWGWARQRCRSRTCSRIRSGRHQPSWRSTQHGQSRC